MDENEPLLSNRNKQYYNNINFDSLFKMLITVYTRPVCIYGYIFSDKCKKCNKVVNNMDDIYYNGIELSKYEIHEYLYHNIEFTDIIKRVLYDNRDSILYLYYRYLRRLA
jgi:hypothetical protein